jgi:hypothetical protein
MAASMVLTTPPSKFIVALRVRTVNARKPLERAPLSPLRADRQAAASTSRKTSGPGARLVEPRGRSLLRSDIVWSPKQARS